MRTFVAIPLPKEIREKIYKVTKEFDEEGVKTVEEENLHITLAFLGELKEQRVEEVKREISKINFKKFEISVKGVSTFPGFLRVIFVNALTKSNELEILHKEVVKALKNLDLIFDERFSPHITIARVNRLPKEKIEKILKKIEEKKEIDFGSFVADKICVMSSKLTQNGPIYNVELEKKLE
jgi:2'-5' RNA ligase